MQPIVHIWKNHHRKKIFAFYKLTKNPHLAILIFEELGHSIPSSFEDSHVRPQPHKAESGKVMFVPREDSAL